MPHIIPKPQTVNYDDFSPSNQDLKIKYGLPGEVLFCKKCTISNQRPNSVVEYKHTKDSLKKTINFDAEGVCDACTMAERKHNTIDWQHREQELKALCDKHRSTDGSYDCLLPGSGGKDSFYAAHILKEKYGMHPYTVTWAPHMYTDWGWRNFQRWIHAGFDNMLMTPNGRVHRLLTRLAVENLFHPFQPFMIGQKALAPKMAAMLNIPLVFFGENEAEYGNPIADNETAQRDWDYFTMEDQSKINISGVSIQSLKDDFGLTKADLDPYMPANPDTLRKAGVQVQYLGSYLKWHPQSCYYYTHEHGGFEVSPERSPGTYSKYNSIDDKIDDLHYFTTATKFGIGRATYDSAQEIRSLDIEREEGVALVKRFDHEFPDRFIDEIFTYLSIPESEFPLASKQFEQPIIDRSYFDQLTDSFRSPHLWQFDQQTWQVRDAVWQDKHQ